MPNNNSVFRDNFRKKVISAINEAHGASEVHHSALSGQIREILVSRMLRPVLIPEVQIGTGKIVNSQGKLSKQIDVILYAPQILPPSLYDEKTGLFPIESCLYSIEVKSKLNATNLKEAIENAVSVRSLPVLPSEHWTGTATIQAGTPLPVNTLFAFGSDLTDRGKSEIERYREIDSNANNNPSFQAICVVGKGYWFHTTKNDKSEWLFREPSKGHDEVMDLLSGITNTIPMLILRKGRPRFGNYIGSEPNFKKV